MGGRNKAGLIRSEAGNACNTCIRCFMHGWCCLDPRHWHAAFVTTAEQCDLLRLEEPGGSNIASRLSQKCRQTLKHEVIFCVLTIKQEIASPAVSSWKLIHVEVLFGVVPLYILRYTNTDVDVLQLLSSYMQSFLYGTVTARISVDFNLNIQFLR